MVLQQAGVGMTKEQCPQGTSVGRRDPSRAWRQR